MIPVPAASSTSSEIRHAGGKPIDANSDAYFELKRWLDNGANRDGIAPAEAAEDGHRAAAATALPPASRRIHGRHVDARLPDVRRRRCMPLLKQSCAYGTCHSSPQADFYLTCGDDDEQMAFNYGQAAGFVVPMPTRGRAERDPAAAAVAAGGRRQPHGRRVLPVARGRRPGRCCATGRRQVQMDAAAGTAGQDGGRDVLRGPT